MDKQRIDSILAPVSAAGNRARQQRVREKFWPAFKRIARNVPFAEDLVAAYFCAMDPATPAKTRAILIAALAYFILPFDVVPDFIIWFGFGDDIAVLTAAIAAVSSSMTEAHRIAARKTLAEDIIPPQKT
jgi:uncharacterized membrane protein YkvA (DUF1232 family)